MHYLRVKSEPMPLFHSTFSMFSMSFGKKPIIMSDEKSITLSNKSKTSFEENAKCSTQRAFNDEMISFL